MKECRIIVICYHGVVAYAFKCHWFRGIFTPFERFPGNFPTLSEHVLPEGRTCASKLWRVICLRKCRCGKCSNRQKSVMFYCWNFIKIWPKLVLCKERYDKVGKTKQRNCGTCVTCRTTELAESEKNWKFLDFSNFPRFCLVVPSSEAGGSVNNLVVKHGQLPGWHLKVSSHILWWFVHPKSCIIHSCM